jgi:hypothetical protein
MLAAPHGLHPCGALASAPAASRLDVRGPKTIALPRHGGCSRRPRAEAGSSAPGGGQAPIAEADPMRRLRPRSPAWPSRATAIAGLRLSLSDVSPSQASAQRAWRPSVSDSSTNTRWTVSRRLADEPNHRLVTAQERDRESYPFVHFASWSLIHQGLAKQAKQGVMTEINKNKSARGPIVSGFLRLVSTTS